MRERDETAPDFLRVEEAAHVLRIGRTAAYQLAREFLATGGASRLPVIRYGRQLRVPRCRLEADLGGPITWPPTTEADRSTAPVPVEAPAPVALTRPTRRRNGSPVAGDVLPFLA
jgi:hypothetical protein